MVCYTVELFCIWYEYAGGHNSILYNAHQGSVGGFNVDVTDNFANNCDVSYYYNIFVLIFWANKICSCYVLSFLTDNDYL